MAVNSKVAFTDQAAAFSVAASYRITQKVIDEAKKLVPNKPIKYLFTTHHHFDHTGGLRTYAAQGATIVTNQSNVAWPWRLRYTGRFTQAGTAGSINGYGSIDISTSLTAFTPRNIPETTSAGIVTVNTSIPMAVTIAGTWGATGTSNTASCHGLLAVVHG